MRILITGGAGFIGSHISQRLVDQGHSILILDDLSSGKREHVPKEAQFSLNDIRSEAAARAITDFAPERIVHLAAQMDVRKSMEDPAFDASVNLAGLANVVESARRGGSLTQVVFAGSGGAMYGEQDTFPAQEDHALAPTSFYGLTKALGEQYLATFERLFNIGWASLRFGNVYGPRQDAHGEAGVVAIFCGRILDRRALTIFGDGKQTRDYVYVEDVCDALMAALEHSLKGAFNVGTGTETSVLDIVAALKSAADIRVEIEHASERPGEQKRSCIDSSKLRKACGLSLSTPLHEGIAKTFEHFKRARD